MENKEHTCPPWVGRLLVSPLRKLYQNPQDILSDFVSTGMLIMEIGPAMGFFSIPLAKLSGTTGKVYCIDLQIEMLEKLNARAKKAGVDDSIITRTCLPDSLSVDDLQNSIDFCLLFAVVHEVRNPSKLFLEVYQSLKSGSKVLFAEPKGHVNQVSWNNSLSIAKEIGFKISESPKIRGSHTAILIKG